MRLIKEFSQGNGAHCGLSDWYPEQEAALKAALEAKAPFDTGWYSSKKEIASARIRSEDGVKIKVEVSVSDDFDTEGLGYASTKDWTVEAVSAAIDSAWGEADTDRKGAQEYEGFRIGRDGKWEETYLVSIGWGENLSPPGDYYSWWGWQHDGDEDKGGIPNPAIPPEIVSEFEKWAHKWAFRNTEEKSLRIGQWGIKPWRDQRPAQEDPNDYRGMGWVGDDGRP